MKKWLLCLYLLLSCPCLFASNLLLSTQLTSASLVKVSAGYDLQILDLSLGPVFIFAPQPDNVALSIESGTYAKYVRKIKMKIFKHRRPQLLISLSQAGFMGAFYVDGYELALDRIRVHLTPLGAYSVDLAKSLWSAVGSSKPPSSYKGPVSLTVNASIPSGQCANFKAGKIIKHLGAPGRVVNTALCWTRSLK